MLHLFPSLRSPLGGFFMALTLVVLQSKPEDLSCQLKLLR
uniref:Uncharacterized protein n=1 Tax=Siphoviridae sp. ctXQ014 TaxID=2825542 RepID=A0A8S5PMV3_9CAUD|nr:MAG TPA: hypothetical protein [Siphoviridae sp. ctXQ014]